MLLELLNYSMPERAGYPKALNVRIIAKDARSSYLNRISFSHFSQPNFSIRR